MYSIFPQVKKSSPLDNWKIILKFSNFYIEPMIPTLCIKPFVGGWILKKRTEILNEDWRNRF